MIELAVDVTKNCNPQEGIQSTRVGQARVLATIQFERFTPPFKEMVVVSLANYKLGSLTT